MKNKWGRGGLPPLAEFTREKKGNFGLLVIMVENDLWASIGGTQGILQFGLVAHFGWPRWRHFGV